MAEIGEFSLGAHVQSLTKAIDNLMKVVDGQGLELQRVMKGSAKQLADSLDRASAASDRHARSLVSATWAMFGASLALVIVTAALVIVTWHS